MDDKSVKEREKLDITSPEFDPLLALTSEIVLEDDSIQVYDNIAQWQRAVLHAQKRTKEAEEKPSYHDSRVKRLRIAEERKKVYTSHDDQQLETLFYKKLNNIARQRGPLSFLYDIWKAKEWVKVVVMEHESTFVDSCIYLDDEDIKKSQSSLLEEYIGNYLIPSEYIRPSHKNSRGFFLGRLLCFDKHMNLILSDVLEVVNSKKALKNMGFIIRRSRRKPPREKIRRDLVYYRKWPVIFLCGSQIIHIQKIGVG